MLSQYLCLLSRGHVTNVDCSNNKVRVSMYVIILQLSQKTFCQTFKDFLIFVDMYLYLYLQLKNTDVNKNDVTSLIQMLKMMSLH